MAHDVFISYSTKDKIIADTVCAKLEESKIRAWIAPRDVPAGSNFAESIIRAINTCKVFVLVWSADTNTSQHILNEINQAFDRGITIIPFRIQDIQPTDEMRYYFGRTHWLDAINPPLENHIATLRDTILVNLGRAMQPDTPPLQPAEEPEITEPEKKPAVEKVAAVKPSGISARKKKSPEPEREIQPKGASQAKLTRLIPFAAAGLIILTLAVLWISGVFKSSPAPEISQVLLSSTATTAPTRTMQPTKTSNPPATATPVPAWILEANTIAEPILTLIKDTPPDFADDFSQIDPSWEYWDGGGDNCAEQTTQNMNIADGSMKVSVEPNCHVRLDNPYFLSLFDDFVYQVDLNFSLTTMLEIGLDRPISNGVKMHFYLLNGAWGIFSQQSNSEEWQTTQEGQILIDPSTPAALTLIKKDTTILFYVNSVLLTSYEIQAEDPDGFVIYFVVSSQENIVRETLELDNIKFWDLDQTGN